MTGYRSKKDMAQDRVNYGASSNYPPQPAQEPKSVTYKEVADTMNALRKGTFEQRQIADEMENKRLYTAPTQRTWVDLTRRQIQDVYFAVLEEHRGGHQMQGQLAFGEALQAIIKEKNNG